MRRLAAILSVTVVALVATGTGAGAVTAPKLVNFSSVGTGQVLSLDLQLPSVLQPVLQAAGLGSKISQAVSFSRSIGQVDKKIGNTGSGLGQMMEGTLNPVLEGLVGRTLPKVFASLGETLKTDALLAQKIGVAGVADLIDVGVMKVSAVSKLANAADGAKAVISESSSQLLGLKVNLGSLVDTLAGLPLVQDVLDTVDGTGGLIDTINGGLDTLVGTTPALGDLVDTLGLDLTLPKLTELLHKPLLTIGLIETGSKTGLAGLARTAEGITRMADIDVLGVGDDALIHIDSLTSEAKVSLGGNAPVATAVNKILGLRVLGTQIDLTKGALTVGGKSFALPIDTVLEPLTQLLTDVVGLEIDVLGTKKSATPTRAFAEANTLKIRLAPKLLAGTPLGLVLEVKGPNSMAEITGVGIQSSGISSTPLPTTGVPTTAFLLAGPALLGLAVLVRKYSLAH